MRSLIIKCTCYCINESVNSRNHFICRFLNQELVTKFTFFSVKLQIHQLNSFSNILLFIRHRALQAHVHSLPAGSKMWPCGIWDQKKRRQVHRKNEIKNKKSIIDPYYSITLSSNMLPQPRSWAGFLQLKLKIWLLATYRILIL